MKKKGAAATWNVQEWAWIYKLKLEPKLPIWPAQDYDFLYQAGVAAVFGPGTSVAKAACEIMNILNEE